MRLTKRVLDAEVAGEKDSFIWCGQTPGFGARIYSSGKKMFVAQVRVGKGIRRVKIGLFGPYTVEKARDPQREKRVARDAPTVAELCDEYLAAHTRGSL
jgi:Arm DNA-binding domain